MAEYSEIKIITYNLGDRTKTDADRAVAVAQQIEPIKFRRWQPMSLIPAKFNIVAQNEAAPVGIITKI